MGRIIILIAVLVCVLAAAASADRLITIPTGKTLSTGGIRLEYAANSDADDGKIYWANIGVSRFEIEGARFEGFGPDKADVISAQVSVLPETSFTPALALGVRDIGDETDGLGLPYDGQSVYLTASKEVPVTGGIPVFFQDVRFHGGIGTGSLGGLFFGVEGKLPMGLQVYGEYDTEDWNYAVSYNAIPTIKLRASWIRDDLYYGALFSTSF